MRLHTHSKGGGQLLHAKGLGEKKNFLLLLGRHNLLILNSITTATGHLMFIQYNILAFLIKTCLTELKNINFL